MPEYLSPGVYVEEVDKGTKPIEAVGTSLAAFIGYTEKAEAVVTSFENGEEVQSKVDLVGNATLVTNWSQYKQKFGDFIQGSFLPDAVYGYFANGGGRCYVVSVKTLGTASNPEDAIPASTEVEDENGKTVLRFTAREGGKLGNGIRVDIKHNLPNLPKGKSDTSDDNGSDKTDSTTSSPLSSSASSTSSSSSSSGGKSGSSEPSSFNLTIEFGDQVETFENLTMARGATNVETVVKQQSKLVFVEVVGRADLIPAEDSAMLKGGDVKTQAITVQDYQGDVAKRKGLGGLEPLQDITMLCMPDLMTSYINGELDEKGVQVVQQMAIDFCEKMRYCFAILDPLPGHMPQEILEWRKRTNYDTSRAALYYPWIEVADLTGANGRTRTVPPCGHIAGIYARNDATRGVHKAPANEVIRGAVGLEVNVTKGEQDMLNPMAVNAIRAFPGRGIRVWGARTLSSDPSWRYINVRRLFNMIEQSIDRGTQWVVFEPNDPNLWARIRRDIRAFLRTVWRTGALFGTTPEQAFYVKCDEETNPQETRDLGQLLIEIGLAPVKPAEFVIFRVSQWAGPDATSE